MPPTQEAVKRCKNNPLNSSGTPDALLMLLELLSVFLVLPAATRRVTGHKNIAALKGQVGTKNVSPR
jgi:hypothetical protein